MQNFSEVVLQSAPRHVYKRPPPTDHPRIAVDNLRELQDLYVLVLSILQMKPIMPIIEGLICASSMSGKTCFACPDTRGGCHSILQHSDTFDIDFPRNIQATHFSLWSALHTWLCEARLNLFLTQACNLLSCSGWLKSSENLPDYE